jgi:cyclic beta-1,2-glucan synthetase
LIARFRDVNETEKALETTCQWWDKTLSSVTIDTPIKSVDILIDRWLLYQTLCCRIWARSAFYQSGGAYGFRDQLQDSMALLYSRPEIARAQILRSAARQFREGDVQHWWHVESGAGPRTRISDDLLWLPFVAAQYIRVTGDDTILDERISWLDAPILADGEHEVFSAPPVTGDTDTLLEHCRRAIAKGATSGPHGLPLIGGGDWNDGFNRVGIEGKGESVWLAWFLIHVRHDMAEMLLMRGQYDEAIENGDAAKALAVVIEREAWDGQWYKRAFFDDGSPLGSCESDEAKIDSLAQSWAVIGGRPNTERSQIAMNSVETNLAREDAQIILLFTPPFDKTPRDPGYIKGYVPGVRENGGQYTHGALWVPMAFARLGDGKRAVKMLQYLNPIEHSRDSISSAIYVVEPYVAAADVYALAGREGRGGWTWYTGSSSWMYRIWIEEILGMRLRGDLLTIAPIVPASWPGFSLRLRHGDAFYNIRVLNPGDSGLGGASATVDGETLRSAFITLRRDAGEHEVVVTLKSSRKPDIQPEGAPVVV